MTQKEALQEFIDEFDVEKKDVHEERFGFYGLRKEFEDVFFSNVFSVKQHTMDDMKGLKRKDREIRKKSVTRSRD